MAASVGFAVLPIIPSLKGFKKKLDRAVTPILNSAGKKAQKDLGRSFKSAFGEMEKAAKKARAESDKLSRSVETASKKQQTALSREKSARAQLERAQRKYTETLSKHQGKIEAQEKQLQALREQGKDKTKTYYNAEAKLQTLRETKPKHIAEHELRIQSARIKLKSATDNLSKAEKNLKDAKDKSAKASKKADDAEKRLAGSAGKAARAKDILKSGAIKAAGAMKKLGDAVGVVLKGLGRLAVAAGGKALGGLKALGRTALSTGASMARAFSGAVVGAVQNLGSKLWGLATTAGKVGVAVGGAIAGIAAKSGFDRLSAIEQSEVKLKTFGINTEKAMEQANAAVKGTAYGLDEAATAISQLSASGIALGKDMSQSLGLVADTAAVTGASMGEISSIYSKIAAAGKLDGGTLDQLQDRGVAVLKALSEETGKTQQEVRKMISDGKIDFQTFADAMEASIGGAAQRSGETVQGSFANVKAALGRLGAEMQETTFNKLPTIFQNIAAGIDALKPVIISFTDSSSSKFAGFVQGVSDKFLLLSVAIANHMNKGKESFEAYKKLPDELKPKYEAIQQQFEKFANSPAIQSIKSSIEEIKAAVSRMTGSLQGLGGEAVKAALTVLSQALGAVAGVLTVISNKSRESSGSIKNSFSDAMTTVTGLTGRAFGAIPGIVQNVIDNEVWGSLKQTIKNVFGEFSNGAPNVSGAVNGSVTFILDRFNGLFTFLNDNWNGISETVKTVFGTIGSIIATTFNTIHETINKNSGGKEMDFGVTLQTKIIPAIQEFGKFVNGVIQQVLPPIVTALQTTLPTLIDKFTNDPNFAKIRESIGEIIAKFVEMLPSIMDVMSNVMVSGLTIIGGLLKDLGPILETVIVPTIEKISKFVQDHPELATKIAEGMLLAFAGSKVVGGVTDFKDNLTGIFGNMTGIADLGKGGNLAKASGEVGGIAGNMGKIGKNGKWLGRIKNLRLVGSLGSLSGALSGVGSSVGGLAASLGTVIGPILAVVAAIAVIVGGLYLFFTKTETGRKAWDKLTKAFKSGYEKYIKPVFEWIALAFKDPKAAFIKLREKIIEIINKFRAKVAKFKAKLNGFLVYIKKRIAFEFEKIKQKIFEKLNKIKEKFLSVPRFFGRQIDKVKDKFNEFKDNINKIVNKIKELWNGLKDTLSKPFKIGGEAVDKVKGWLGFGKKDDKPKGGKKFARGGVLPGYTPGRDIYRFVDDKLGMVLHLSGGEAIMRPEWVKAIGGASEVARLNRAAASGQLLRSMRAKSSRGSGSKKYRFASGGVFKPRSANRGAMPGGGNLTLNNPTLKTNNVKVDAQQARVEALKKARENADNRAADKKALADLRADLYTTLNDDQVSQARGSLLKEQAAATEAAAKLANARRFNDPKKDIERLNLEKQVADARVISSAKQLKAAIAQEAADKKAEARQKAEDAASAAKSLADAKAELYSLLNPGEVGQATGAVQKASADVMAAADALRIAQQFGDKPEVIQRLTYEKQIADVKLTTAEEELRLAQEKAAEEAKAQKREEENKRLDHVKTIRDLEAEIASLIDKSGVGSAKSEYMKAQADAARAVAALKQAMRYGDEKETIERLKLEARVAKLKERAAKKAIAAAEAEAKAERAKQRRDFFDNAADNYAKLDNLRIDIYAERNKSNDYAASVATYEKAMVDAHTALRKYQNAVMVNANYEEIRTLALERQLAVLKANNAREDMLAEKRQRAKKAAEKQAEKLKELAEEQTKYLKVVTSLGTSWERQANSLKAFSDMFKEVGESAKKATDDLRSAIIDFVVGFTSVAKAAFEVDRTMQAVTKTRLEGIAKVKEAEAKLTKERTKQFKLMTTAASGLAGADKLTSGYFSTVDRLGGVFVTNADEMRKAQADLLVARAQAAYDLAKAEADEKKARLEYKKSLYEQVKATRLLNVQLAEYISKQMLVNGLNNRQTDALSQYFSARSDILQAESAIEAAREQVKFGQIARDAQKVQEGMIALSEAQSKLTNAQFKQSLYADEAAQAFAKLPLHLQLGMKAAEAQDRQVTANAIRKAIARGDFESANAAAAMSGRILNSYLESISGIRKSLDEFTTREANYRRENINYRYDTIIAGLDNSINALDLSASKALEAYQAQLDAANALKSAAETEDIDARRAWVEAARQSNEYALQAGEKSRAYNKHMGNNVTVNFEPDGYYSGEQLAKQLAAATDRIESVEVQLSGKKVSASDYFSAH